MGNLFKGKTYEGTSFIIDKIYRCKVEMDAAAATDGVFVGRYVLVAYSDEALSQDKRNQLEAAINGGGSVPSASNLNTSEKQYKYYFNKDGKISHDRKIFRKKYIDNTWEYEEIAFLNSSLSDESIAVLGLKEGDSILHIDGNRILSSTLRMGFNQDNHKLYLKGYNNVTLDNTVDANDILKSTLQLVKQNGDQIVLTLKDTSATLGTVDIGEIIKDNLRFEYDSTTHRLNLFMGTEATSFAYVDATAFIKDSFLQNVDYDTNTHTLTFTFTTQNGTETIGPIPIDIMDAGNGIKITGNDIAIKLDTTSSDSENFLSLSNKGLKISGIQQAIEDYVGSGGGGAVGSIVWTEIL